MTTLIGRDDVLAAIQRKGTDVSPVADVRGELGSGRTRVLTAIQMHWGGGLRVFDCRQYNPGHPGQVGSRVSVGAAQASYSRWIELLEEIAESLLSPEDAKALRAADAEARGVHVLGRSVSLEHSLLELEQPFEAEHLVRAWRGAARDVAKVFVNRWRSRGKPGPLLLDNVETLLDQEVGRWLVHLLALISGSSDDAPGTVAVVLARSVAEGESNILVLPDGVDDADVADAADEVDAHGSVVVPSVHRLHNLTRPEIARFVQEFRPDKRSAPGETVRRIQELTDGHPATLQLVCELLYGPGGPSDKAVDQALAALPPKGPRQAAMLVEDILERSNRGDLFQAVELAAVPRTLDASLHRVLLATDGCEAPGKGLFDALQSLSFVEVVDARRNTLRLHECVRGSLLARMEAADPYRLAVLNGRAAEYFASVLEQDHEDSRGTVYQYGDLYLYELPSWQAHVREWLYHSGKLVEPRARRRFLLHAANHFLNAFFWWGNYVHFDFCDTVVADLEQLCGQRNLDSGMSTPAPGSVATSWPELRRLHDSFVTILAHYPPRSMKSVGTEWVAVRTALQSIEDVCGVRRSPRLSRLQRHVRALLQVFTAHTYRYAPWTTAQQPELAELAYQEALALFRTVPDDEWALAWMQFERAELALARVRWAESRSAEGDGGTHRQLETESVKELWRQAAVLVQPPDAEPEDVQAALDVEAADDDWAEHDHQEDRPDHELMANLHRLRGEILADEGRVDAAADSFGRAVLHAYLFHNVGGPPDEYTLQFYVDVRARALAFLLSLWRSSRDTVAVEAARRLAAVPALEPLDDGRLLDLLRTAADRGHAQPLAEALWPPGPDIVHLGDPESAYAQQVRAVRSGLDYDRFYLHDLDVHHEWR